jgi:hypothetical protein
MARNGKKPEPEKSAEPKDEGLEAQFLPKPSAAEMQVETLSGDIRDVLLSHFRDIKVPWAMLNEEEQRDKIEALTNASFDLVRKTLAVISASKFPIINVAIGKFTVDKGVKIECTASPSVENITHLAQHGKGSGVLVLAEARDYFGERAPARPDPNQKSFPLDEEPDDQ